MIVPTANETRAVEECFLSALWCESAIAYEAAFEARLTTDAFAFPQHRDLCKCLMTWAERHDESIDIEFLRKALVLFGHPREFYRLDGQDGLSALLFIESSACGATNYARWIAHAARRRERVRRHYRKARDAMEQAGDAEARLVIVVRQQCRERKRRRGVAWRR